MIAGELLEPWYFRQLEQLVHDVGLTERVEFLGLRDDILQLMQQATVLVHCAESEAFGWVIAEAMAVGLPVIAAAVDGPSEVIEHGKTGFLVPVGDVEQVCRCSSDSLDTTGSLARICRKWPKKSGRKIFGPGHA